MAFSDKSKELREEFGLTQAQLANEIKVSRSCISMIEIGKNEPTASTLTAYAKFFKISIDELLGCEYFTTPTATPMDDGLSAEERDLIRKYRALPEKLRQMVRDNIEVYSERNELLPKNSKKV